MIHDTKEICRMGSPVPVQTCGDYLNINDKTLKHGDLAVFFCTLIISAAIGVFFTCSGGRQQTVDEFLMANKRMHWLPVGISLLSSFQSALTVVGTPLEVYKYGTTHMWILIGYPLAIWISLSLFVPVLYKLRYNSVNQYLKERFNCVIAYISLGYFVLSMLFYLSLVLYIPSAIFGFVNDGDQGESTTIYIIASVGLCCIAYFTLGGIKAVLWTDTFQYIVMFSGVLLITIWGLSKDGRSVFLDAENSGRLDFKNFRKIFNPTPKLRFSVMALAFGSATSWISLFSVTQTQVQRVWTLNSMHDVKKAYILNSIGLPLFNFLCIINGLIVFSYFKFCDPLGIFKQCIIEEFQLLPYYVLKNFSDYNGLSGLITVAFVAGSISTINSGINSVAACIYYDILLHMMPNHARQSGAVISKLVGIIFGLLIIVTSITVYESSNTDTLVLTLFLFDMFGGPVLGLFSLGLFTKRANALGSGIAFVAGIVLTVVIGGMTVKNAGGYPPIMSFNYTEECCHNNISFKNACSSNSLNPLQNMTISSWNNPNLWNIDFTKGELCYQFVVFIGFFTVLFLGLPLSIVIEKFRNHENHVSDNLQSDLRQIFLFLPQSLRRRVPFLRHLEDTRYERIAQEDEEPNIYKTIYDEDGKVLLVIQSCQLETDETEVANNSESSSDESSDSSS